MYARDDIVLVPMYVRVPLHNLQHCTRTRSGARVPNEAVCQPGVESICLTAAKGVGNRETIRTALEIRLNPDRAIHANGSSSRTVFVKPSRACFRYDRVPASLEPHSLRFEETSYTQSGEILFSELTLFRQGLRIF